MIALRVLLALTLLAAPVAAQAQTWQPRAGAPVVDPYR